MNDTEIEKEIKEFSDKFNLRYDSQMSTWWLKKLHQRDEKWRKGVEAISEYIQHTDNCIRNSLKAGEPTKNGYRQKFRGKWYEARPNDKTPKCDCNLDNLLKLMVGGE